MAWTFMFIENSFGLEKKSYIHLVLGIHILGMYKMLSFKCNGLGQFDNMDHFLSNSLE
jgi:hypothetical protein